MLQMSIVTDDNRGIGVYKVKSLDEAKAIVAGTEKAVCAAVASFDGERTRCVGSYYQGKWVIG